MAFFISGCILILMSSTILAEYTFNCSEYEEPVILETHFCRIKMAEDADPTDGLMAVLPNLTASDNFRSAEIVTITPPSNKFRFEVKNKTELLNLFPSVRFLSIGSFESVDFANAIRNERFEVTKQLFDLPALDSLTFTDAHLNSKTHNWTLPDKLQYLNFANNDYTDYDIRNLKYVKVVDFSKNNLNEIPKLAYPLRTLTELNLSENPLNNVTTEDIAKLCTLEKLNLMGTSLTQSSEPERICECRKLHRWADRLQMWLKGEHFKSFELSMEPCNEEVDVKCSEVLGEKYSLNEAFLRREHCLTGRSSTIGEVNLKLEDMAMVSPKVK